MLKVKCKWSKILCPTLLVDPLMERFLFQLRGTQLVVLAQAVPIQKTEFGVFVGFLN